MTNDTGKIDMLGLQAYLAVAQAGGFGRAAETLCITQAALSRRLIKLEKTLDMPLVERSSRGARLSPAGEQFRPAAEALVRRIEATLQALRDKGASGSACVSFACSPAVALHHVAGVVAAYMRTHPAQDVRVVDRFEDQIEADVIAGHAEFGILLHRCKSPELRGVHIADTGYVAVTGPTHPIARLAQAARAELAPYAVAASAPDHALAELLGTSAQWEPGPRHVTCEVANALTLAASGSTVAIIPRVAWHASSHPRLQAIPFPGARSKLWAVSRRGSRLSAAAATLLDMLRAELRAVGDAPPGPPPR